MRLQLALGVVVLLTASTASAQEEPAPDPAPAPAPAPEPEVEKPKSVDGRVVVEVAGYHDNRAVSVLTPSAAATLTNPTAGWNANGRYLVDVVTAASPDVVSTASPRWTEVRHAGNLGAQYKPGDTGVAVGGATSYTPDYLALNANAQLTQDLFEKNLTLLAGYGFGHDVIGRVNTPFSVFSRQLDYHSIVVGASQVVNEAMVVGVYADVMIERGDQSKPYRYVPIFGTQEASQSLGPGAAPADVARQRIHAKPLEQLPLERERAALTGRLAWRLSSSTLRLEERVYADTWGLVASTTDFRWYFDVSERVMLFPHLRAHVQNGVTFWERTYVASPSALPAIRAGDRELSPLTNGTLGGGLRIGLGRSGHVDDFVLGGQFDATYTEFHDTLFVKNRLAGLLATTLEVAF
jgi:hypothetical protein